MQASDDGRNFIMYSDDVEVFRIRLKTAEVCTAKVAAFNEAYDKEVACRNNAGFAATRMLRDVTEALNIFLAD